MRRELERIEIPGEHEARERSWAVVRDAYAEREPASSERSILRPALVLVAAGIVVAAALSPPGRAVLGSVRDAVLPERIERVQPALVSLPGPGRLLVVSAEHGGVWVVSRDGSKRRLGDYEDASWSPFGRYVLASSRNELLALTPEGEERWSLARRDVSQATWGGSRTDTRIAYRARSGLRVVGGDGKGDRLLAPAVTGPLSWLPGPAHQLAYVDAGEVRLQDADTGRVLWRANAGTAGATRSLDWSADGSRLLLVQQDGLVVLDGTGRTLRVIPIRGRELVAGSFAPSGHAIAMLLRAPGTVTPATRTEIRLLDADRPGRSRQVFAGQGDFGELAWSPDGRRLLVAWRSADEWLFVDRASGRVVAIANVDEQFPRADGRPPLLLLSDRWCCAT